MFDTAFGLPVHVLVVHAVVVLVPLSALGVAAIAARPVWRLTFGWLVLAIAAVATVLVPVATQSGEELKHRIGETPAIETHADLGDQLLWFMVPMLILAIAVVLLERNRRPRSAQTTTLLVLSVVAVLASVAVIVQVVRIGHTGAGAVWKPVIQSTTQGGADGGDD